MAIGAATVAVTTSAITSTFGIISGHALTWPFVLVTWVFLAAVPTLSTLRRTVCLLPGVRGIHDPGRGSGPH
ncbi:urea transporter [Actinomadura nitritigenes]|uniref:urea transporter n=1 Tax=Actinomadura nitritigenes TaxID=134602 RepID=UPI003D89EC57